MQTPLPQPCGEAAPCAGQPSAADDAAMEVEEEVFLTQLPEYWDRPYHHATHGACAAPCASPLHAQLQDAHTRHEEVQGFLESALHHMAQQHQTILSLEAGLQDRARWATQWGQQQLHAAAEQEAWEAHEHRAAAEQEAREAHEHRAAAEQEAWEAHEHRAQARAEEGATARAAEEERQRARSQALDQQRVALARALAEEEAMKQRALVEAQRRALEDQRVALCRALRPHQAEQEALHEARLLAQEQQRLELEAQEAHLREEQHVEQEAQRLEEQRRALEEEEAQQLEEQRRALEAQEAERLGCDASGDELMGRGGCL